MNTPQNKISLHHVYTPGEKNDIDMNVIQFAGGEPHVANLSPDSVFGRYVWLDARISDGNGFMALLMAMDAVRACKPKRMGLFLPYFPGARQDRRQPGFAFSAKVYADCIRQMSPDCVLTFDPHSDVLGALLEIDTLRASAGCIEPDRKFTGVIAPDTGAAKRASFAAGVYRVPLYQSTKTRDSLTGALTGFAPLNLPDGHFLVVDDICDGGGTFVGLAQVNTNPNAKLSLSVSHGIFSKGLDALLSKFDRIYTTDSFPSPHLADDRVTVTPLHAAAANHMYRKIAT